MKGAPVPTIEDAAKETQWEQVSRISCPSFPLLSLLLSAFLLLAERITLTSFLRFSLTWVWKNESNLPESRWI
jgi:hypothetical protein